MPGRRFQPQLESLEDRRLLTVALASHLSLYLAPTSDTGIFGDNLTNRTRPAFFGSATPLENVGLYEGSKLLGHAITDEDGTFNVSPTAALSDGEHALIAMSLDAKTSAIPTSPTLLVGIDTTAPATPANLQLEGGIQGSNVTNQSKPTVSGLADSGTFVSIFDGSVLLGTTVADAQSHWQFTVPNDLSDGVHAFSAKSIDIAGNVSPSSQVLSVTVMTAAPAAPSELALAPASDTNPVGDQHTTVLQPTITGLAPANTTVTLWDGGTNVGLSPVDGSGNWSVKIGNDLSVGTHTFTATATDLANQTSVPSAPLLLVIDPVPGNPEPGTNGGPGSGEGQSKTLTVGVTGPDVGVPGQTLAFTLDVGGAAALTGLAIQVHWGDGSSDTYYPNTGSNVPVTHLYSHNGTFHIQVDAHDQAADHGTAEHLVDEVFAAALEPDPNHPNKTFLFLGGTPGDDAFDLSVHKATGAIDVWRNGVNEGSFMPTGGLGYLLFGQGGIDQVHETII